MRSAFLIGSVSAIVLGGGIGGCAKIRSRDLIREGNAAYEAQAFEVAIDRYTRSLEIEPEGVTVRWNRACAAEAAVLARQGVDPASADAQRRHELADLGLEDFSAWLQRLEAPTDEDRKLVEDHRLALLDADARCDALIEHWMAKHRAEPKEESWYGVIARQYERCDRPDEVEAWFVKRTEDFPGSVRAWHQLAIRAFEPLWPDPESGLPFNDRLRPSDRIEVADEVIALLDKATEIDPEFRDAYIWRAMAYTQRQHARIVVDEPTLPEERLEAIRAREDSMSAWHEQKQVCDLDGLVRCSELTGPPPEGQACCPDAPLTPEDVAADAQQKVEVLAQIAAADAEVEGR